MDLSVQTLQSALARSTVTARFKSSQHSREEEASPNNASGAPSATFPPAYSPEQAKFDIEALHDKVEHCMGLINDHLSKSRARISEAVDELARTTQASADSTLAEADAITEELRRRRTEISELASLVSGDAVYGSHSSKSKEEERSANWLRFGALAFMCVAAALVAYSVWEATQFPGDWKIAVYRLALSFVLTIPAAYLAKESAKHREQGYALRQTALDLAALDPYSASLPEDARHKIKIEIARRIFASRDFSGISKSPFPINAQELLLAAIKRSRSAPPTADDDAQS